MNIYYNPEHYELVPVAEIDYSDGDYCFDLRVVWRSRLDGRLYTARDSGCSCPSPFEDYGSLESLDALHLPELEQEAADELRGTSANRTPAEVAHFLREVRDALAAGEKAPVFRLPLQRVGWLEHIGRA